VHTWLTLRGSHHPPAPNDDDVLRAYVDAQAHAVVPTLHAQVIAILNIKSMIHVLLDNLSPNYSWWKVLFLNTIDKYELVDHVLPNLLHHRSALAAHRLHRLVMAL
jgi:hypothetical protein